MNIFVAIVMCITLFDTYSIDGMFRNYFFTQQNQVSHAKFLRNRADDIFKKNQSNVVLKSFLDRMPIEKITFQNSQEVIDDIKPLLFLGNQSLQERYTSRLETLPKLFAPLSYNPFCWGRQASRFSYNIIALPVLFCEKMYRESEEILKDTMNSLNISDSLWMLGGYFCAEGFLRQVHGDKNNSILSSLYVILPCISLILKKKWDLDRVMQKSLQHLQSRNQDLLQAQNNLQESLSQSNQRILRLEQSQQVLLLQHGLTREIERREHRRLIDTIMQRLRLIEDRNSQLLVRNEELEFDNQNFQNRIMSSTAMITLPYSQDWHEEQSQQGQSVSTENNNNVIPILEDRDILKKDMKFFVNFYKNSLEKDSHEGIKSFFHRRQYQKNNIDKDILNSVKNFNNVKNINIQQKLLLSYQYKNSYQINNYDIIKNNVENYSQQMYPFAMVSKNLVKLNRFMK